MIDHIITNANIYTQNPAQPHAAALAIAGERILAVGSNDDIKALKSAHTLHTDAGGRRIIPGLTDAHLHWHNYSRLLQAVDLVDVPSKAEAVRRVAEQAKNTPPGEWIFGIGWRKDLWDGAVFPTALDLDVATTNHPVYLVSRSGHAAWANTLAFQRAGIPDDVSDPPGGGFTRNADGKPAGVLLEKPAMNMIAHHMPRETVQTLSEWMEQAQQTVLRMGMTGFHDYDNPICMDALQLLRERGWLNLRVLKQINVEWIEHAYGLGIHSGFGDDWLRFGGLKIFADGALGPQTALMAAPYEGSTDNYGIVVTDKETMHELVHQASANGLFCTIHAIGDRAVHDVLNIFESVRQAEAEQKIPRALRRHRIEHVQITLPEDVERLAELDVIASMQTIHATSDYIMADRYWGTRAEYSYATRKQLNAGATLVLGSDAPLDNIDPLAGIHAAVTRRRADGSPGPEGWYPAEKLTLEEAIAAYTTGPAYAAMMENRLGRLAPGFLADLVMLDRDIFAIDPMEILEVKVLGTMVGGSWRFQEF